MNQNKKPPMTPEARKGCISTAIAVVVVFFIVKSCFFGSSSAPKERYSKVQALVSSHSFVEDKLKSPSSAEFDTSISGVQKLNDSTFLVQSFVDSQNGFGAMLRSNYMCKITFLPGDQAKCESLVLQ